MEALSRVLTGDSRSARGFKKDLTEAEYSAIIAARNAGVPQRQLAAQFDYSTKTITRISKRLQNHQTLKALPGKDCEDKFTAAEKRYIRQIVKRNPRISWATLINNSGIIISKNTLQRISGKNFR